MSDEETNQVNVYIVLVSIFNGSYHLPLIEKFELQVKNRDSTNEIDETRDLKVLVNAQLLFTMHNAAFSIA
jgi:hypothetical protein